jgi:beta-glucan synthesis-associated protein KRE6
MLELIDADTPKDARSRTGFDRQEYDLVFSDEFNVDGRTFFPGCVSLYSVAFPANLSYLFSDNPFWEAADLWYWATADEEWYDPAQVTTKNGKLNILMENVETHGLPYRSGMLQSWNKFCFTSGYIEVSVSLPGPNEQTRVM